MTGLIDTGSSNLDTTIRLIRIEEKIDDLIAGSSAEGMQFNLLTLSPIYNLSSSSGWSTSPINLENITDENDNTSTNLFEVGGSAFRYGEILINPGVSIPSYTRINFRVGLQNSNAARNYFELAAYNVSSAIYTSLWGTIDNQSNTTDSIINVDRIVPFVWDKLRFQLWDIGQFYARAKIYNLRVWEVS